VLPPVQTAEGIAIICGSGAGNARMLILSRRKQPLFRENALTEYWLRVSVNTTEIGFRTDRVLQTKSVSSSPVAVSTMVSPRHAVVSPLIWMRVTCLTISWTMEESIQPELLVAVTVYVLVWSGRTTIEESDEPVFHA